MNNDLPSTSEDESRTHLKPYHEPQLVVYGDIRTITRITGGMSGMNDGGGGPDKTGP